MKSKKVETLTAKEILTSLKPSQIWSIVLVIAGLISGSLALGYKLAGLKMERASITNQELAALKNKERFLSLLHRYNYADEDYRKAANNIRLDDVVPKSNDDIITTDDEIEEMIDKMSYTKEEVNKKMEIRDNANRALLHFVRELVKKGEVIEDINNMQGATIGKGDTDSDVTIKFNYDNTIWTLPPDVATRANKRAPME